MRQRGRISIQSKSLVLAADNPCAVMQFKEAMEQIGCEVRHSTPRYPQSNGGVERVNRDIKVGIGV